MTNQISFLGEFEFQTISTLSPTSTLARVWPTTDLFGFETENGFHALIVGFAKLVANSFTVAGGYRECFIFPFFASGASFGRALCAIFPGIPTIPLACLSFAAGINAGITRTALATPIILCFLAGEQKAMSGVLAASLASQLHTCLSLDRSSQEKICKLPCTQIWIRMLRLTRKRFLSMRMHRFSFLPRRFGFLFGQRIL